jgi:hypothetical protein
MWPMYIWRADTPIQAYTQAWWMSPTCLEDTPRASADGVWGPPAAPAYPALVLSSAGTASIC